MEPNAAWGHNSIEYWNERASQIEWRRGELRGWLRQMDKDFNECVANIERIKSEMRLGNVLVEARAVLKRASE